jgi:putative hydrolase of the HAD superfamily
MGGTGKPKAVLFDLWGTLIATDLFDPARGNAAVLECAENPSGITLADVQALGDKVVSSLESREEQSRIEFTQQSLLRILADSFGLRFSLPLSELEWVFWSSAMTINVMEGAVEALSRLHARGIRACVVSNSSFTSVTIEKELSRLGLLPHFEFVVSSTDYGVRKPDGILFDVALRRLGVMPHEAWFVGDNILYDIEGPWDAGILPVLYTGNGDRKGDVPSRITDYLAISHWREFDVLIENAEGRV